MVGLGRRRADFDTLGFQVQFPCETEQFDQGLARRRQGIAWADGVLGLHVEDQLVEVGALLDAGGLDLVGHLEHRRINGIDRDTADFGAGGLVHHGGNIATAALDDELDLELALIVECRDVHVRVVHDDSGGRHDIACRDRTGPLLAQVHGDRLILIGGHDEALEVEDDVGDVFLDTGNRGELVQDAVDADARHGCAGDRGQQGTAQ